MKQFDFDNFDKAAKKTVGAMLALYFLLTVGSIIMTLALLGGAVWLVVAILQAMGVL